MKNVVFRTLRSLSSLLGDFFTDFWPGFLALDQNGDGTDGRDGRTDGRIFGTRPERGRDGRTGRTDGRNTVLQYYWDGEIQCYNTSYYSLFNLYKTEHLF